MTRDQGDVLGLEGGKGLIARDRFGNFLQRRIVAGSMMVYVTEGDGETGNPYIDVIPGNIDHAELAGLTADPNPHEAILGDLDDAAITSPADNALLAYDSGTSKWINQTPAETGVAAASHNHNASDINAGTLGGARLASKHKRIVYPQYIGKPEATDVFLLDYVYDAFTVDKVYGVTDAGTFSFHVEHRSPSAPFSGGVNVMSSVLVADSNGQSKTSAWNDNTVPADRWLFVVATAVNSAAKCCLLVTGTIDD
ncbi:MAG: hypothetical protein ACYTFA_00190 [Planctomycetota bacterium]|jgi:hypothetical protein